VFTKVIITKRKKTNILPARIPTHTSYLHGSLIFLSSCGHARNIFLFFPAPDGHVATNTESKIIKFFLACLKTEAGEKKMKTFAARTKFMDGLMIATRSGDISGLRYAQKIISSFFQKLKSVNTHGLT
jgi:superfamily II DNA or RNA helicase